MSTTLARMAKHSAIYAAGDILAKIVGLLLLPLYSRKFSAFEYGILALIQIINTFPSRLATQGIATSSLKALTVDYADDADQRRVAISTAYFYLLLSSLAVNGLLLLSIPLLSRWVLKSDDYRTLLALAFAASVLESTQTIPLNVLLRARFRSVFYSALSFAQFLASVSLNIYFIVYLDTGIAGIIYTDLIVAAGMAVAGFAIIKPDLVWVFSYAEVRRMVRYGWPLVPARVSMWLLDFADRFQLQRLSTTVEVGLYAVGAKYAKIFQFFFLTQFEKVWPSVFFPLSRERDAAAQFARLFTYLFLAGCGLGLGVILFVDPVVKLTLEPSYWRASHVVGWLVAGFILEASYQVFSVGLRITDNTRRMPTVVGAAAAFNILANFWVLPRWGMVGAGFTTFCANGVLVALAFHYSRRIYPVPYEWGRLARVAVLFAGILALDLFWYGRALVIAIPAKVVELLAFPLGLWMLGVVTSDEIRSLASSGRSVLRRGGKPLRPQRTPGPQERTP